MRLSPLLALSVLALAVAPQSTYAAPPPLIQSAASGPWSAAATWDAGRVPQAGDIVLIRSSHEVTYDVKSTDVIRSVHVSGRLKFATNVDTQLEVGLIRIQAGDEALEEGFDCDLEHVAAHAAGPPAELWIGSPDQPIAAENRCLIRLHAIAGTDAKSWPAIVCCGGRMEIHGAPLSRTWVKLTRTADAGATRLFLSEPVEGWNAGDQLLITGTFRQEPIAGTQTEHVSDQPASEVRRLGGLSAVGGGNSMTGGALQTLALDQPLRYSHRGGDYSAEVANLSRNVVIESADPDGARGHTMYHHGSSGSISYAELRHLGKPGVLGRYPIHFHLAADSMRGSSVIGASIWDSGNRWITVHGTQYLVVRDNVGYQSVGHGFFLEDGSEAYNIFDRNLAVQALVGAPLPEQVLPYDLNDGAGFWWANSLNAFTRNVAVECDQHGFRFEAEKTKDFDPRLAVMQPDGTMKSVDIRTLPFIRFDDNEVHCHRRFGLNLGGIRGLTYQQFGDDRTTADFASSVGGTTAGVGPDAAHPFVIRNFRAWDTHWAFHTFCPAVKIDGLDVYDCNYGVWRSIIDLHQYDNISFRQIHSHAIFFPMGGHGPAIEMGEQQPTFPNYRQKDDLPPVTVITRVRRTPAGTWLVQGSSVDNNQIARVEVSGVAARSLRDDYAEWEAEVPASELDALVAYAVDDAHNVEPVSHRWDLTRAAKPHVHPAGHKAHRSAAGPSHAHDQKMAPAAGHTGHSAHAAPD